METPDWTFEIKPSRIPDAGDGLFASGPIEAGRVFRVQHSRPRLHARVARDDVEVMPVFPVESCDWDTPCVVDGCVSTLRRTSFGVDRKRYVHARRQDSIFMKANDKAWRTGLNEAAYLQRTVLNNMELVLVFEKRRGVGIAAHTLRHIASGEEIGITYGFDYWVEGAE